MNSGINRDDWIKALEDAGRADDNPDAVTINEFAEMFNLTPVTAGRRLEELTKAGKAMRCKKRMVVSNGRTYGLVAYKLVK